MKPDLCIIGAGSAGLTLAAGAAQMGARVVLIEAGEMGGDCLHTGCVPSKALIAAARQAHAMTAGAGLGVAPVIPQIDHAAVTDHIARVIAGIAPHDSQQRFEGLGVRVIRARARFTAPHAVEAAGETIRARRFVIATGARPVIPPILGLDAVSYLTNETIFALRERPEHLLILGGGAVGIEIAQAQRRLGAQVTVLEAGRALGGEDPEMAAVVVARLRVEGVVIHERVAVASISGREGAISIQMEGGAHHAASHLLVATGRRPHLSDLGLEAAGIAHTTKGVTVGRDLRSSNRRVYAIGDAAGGAQFTHLAAYHAGIVLRSALFGLPAEARADHIPRVVYTDPELAQVGLTETEAREVHGRRLTVVRWPFAEIDRARTEGLGEGFCKVMVVRGRPVGAGIVGPQAGELIAPWALALSARLKMSQMASVVLPYPTLAEVGKRAAGAYFSPRLFANPWIARLVGLVRRLP